MIRSSVGAPPQANTAGANPNAPPPIPGAHRANLILMTNEMVLGNGITADLGHGDAPPPAHPGPDADLTTDHNRQVLARIKQFHSRGRTRFGNVSVQSDDRQYQHSQCQQLLTNSCAGNF